ncbi:MAG TPA: AAA family ATPase [Geminicoccaceae bacterium]|jgi:chromosome partitioning protein|nr:AAA family ATPase [Geminicoccaceae bacterium]
MRVLSLVSQKGGVGKTTLATALAVAAHRDGKRPVLIDLDPQASASFWMDTRQDDGLAVSAIPSSRLGHVLKAAAEAGAELAVIDTPPFAKDIAYEAAERADFVLVPTRPAVLDVMAMTRTIDLIKAFQKQAAVVLTFCPPAGKEIDDTEVAVRALEAELCPVRIGTRIAYSRAQQSGLAAQELDPHGKAAAEIRDLYVYTHQHLYREEPHERQAAERHASRP